MLGGVKGCAEESDRKRCNENDEDKNGERIEEKKENNTNQ